MINRLLDFIYPSVCELCQTALTHGDSLCESCATDLPRIKPPFCQNCGEPFDGNIDGDFQCQNCLGLTHDFKFARASLRGRDETFQLVHNLKYLRRFHLSRSLAELMHETIETDARFQDLGPDAILIPVPLHWRRQQWRHGNQAHELGRTLATLSGLPYRQALRRNRATITQTKLNRKQRLTNLRGAFSIKKKHLLSLRGANVILIDDVFTTGATAHECTRILKHEGKVSKVAILTLVRG